MAQHDFDRVRVVDIVVVENAFTTVCYDSHYIYSNCCSLSLCLSLSLSFPLSLSLSLSLSLWDVVVCAVCMYELVGRLFGRRSAFNY